MDPPGTHGFDRIWEQGCRCDLCVKAHRLKRKEYNAGYRARLRAKRIRRQERLQRKVEEFAKSPLQALKEKWEQENVGG